ncbi:N-acetylmuramic acid 6-phosphate etherase [Cytophagaceae bacterium ABcell3]|nr:N-acetylmuramic acid 6-phosphate etherase [Cytophagaceae bacterium ABcell3]
MKLTESPSPYHHLEKMSVSELLHNMNKEDKTVPNAVEKAIPQIEKLVNAIVQKMQAGGRLFYVGAGTSGRLAIADASECPPTYGVPPELVTGLIAGGEKAIRQAVEFAEDDPTQAHKDLEEQNISSKDVLIGISASGKTPYVTGAVAYCNNKKILTGCITCNPDTPLAEIANYPVEVITGPEFVTGSTRLKAGTAQKLTLNMISTSVMIRLGRVKDNKMVDMQLNNNKLFHRGIKMLAEELKIEKEDAEALLKKHGSVRKAAEWYKANART